MIERIVHSHHVFKARPTPVIDKQLCVQVEEDNTYDVFADAIRKMEQSLVIFHKSWQEPPGISPRNDTVTWYAEYRP